MARKGYLSLIGANGAFKNPNKPKTKRKIDKSKLTTKGAGAKGAKKP